MTVLMAPPGSPPSTALLTDHYELTMIRAALRSKTANRASVFELFARRLPEGRRYGVVAGVGRALEAIKAFRFDESALNFLLEENVIDTDLADWLSRYKFKGNVWGYPEGEVYFPGSPLLIVEGTFAETSILETLLLSIYNYDSAVASAASRMTAMAGERPCIEMGSRRTNEYAAVAAARAAYIAGFQATSNLEAGRSFGVPTAGTAAHSFTLLHDSEEEAFKAQLKTLGKSTTLLVDTYDIEEAVRTGVRLSKGKLGAIRLDSGDLAEQAADVRKLLDSLGATETRIIVTSDLDEHQIAALRSAPVDGYGVGTSLVTGSGAPTCGFVYKLVARADSEGKKAELVPVAKKSVDKVSVGGRKFALRRLNAKGRAEAEVIGIGAAPANDGNDRSLLVELMRKGKVVAREPLEDARARHLRARAELPQSALKMSKGEPAIPTVLLDDVGDPTANPYAGKQ
ncbi:nicotinate phosphoribosyltransferase [Propionicimonas sp.]|uniref:nicotinate phosphoribosyltransferase n=1 Tax=Propionicimonas sp. TaxID=1955623 RepID=UPI0018326720|nr:nicotinate phosphoribosyltransferase [Propionicimonas sp.]MBU3977127.1 nicotinate phosphoribosyltransferase [Actinomycetota bacterium]MBA3020696.1 nicotinate phosphoribosyltransferase [Propionicimonas sp.]MBU3985067.1 nicotinate phosphoribosyltransferase [Actinomycetota bacterium]MBU4006976.1 nicotinate phosphoribosyltransferase [Actinomycetota bacterium]MBU4064729.1 nicotinate phosphoribosyltransferase [Actinomycetota bacterium]